jgi:hypothetical protein
MLASIEGGLRAVWDAAKPLYETGQPEAALLRTREQVDLPVPAPLVPVQLTSAGVPRSDLPKIRAIIAAYNRSNGMNLLALSGLVLSPSGMAANDPVPPPPLSWPAMPPLLTQADVDVDTWQLLQRLNRFGATPDEPGLATMWRHLAHWPGLLALIDTGLAPLQEDGTIQRAIHQVLDCARERGGQLAFLRPAVVSMPEAARAMIKNYVHKPGLVARMVAIGHGLAKWLAPTE